jgi:Protein of unknown function (DUF3486)
MGIRSKVARLPAAVRAELDRRIVEGAFSGYQALAEWLQAQGYRIADDSVQRYGARLRHQLEAINLAREHVKALAAAGKRAGESADSLTAISVHLIQQQVLSILLQTAQPESSDQTETTDGEPKALDLRDLQRLSRIIADLNRVTNGRHQPAGKAAQAPAKPMQKGLSEEAYHAIRNVLLERHPVEAYSGDYPPDQTDTTPAEPVANPAEPAEATAESTQPVAGNAAPAEAQQSSSEITQPQLTAAPCIYPHTKLHRVPLDNITNWTWATIVHPKRVSFPLRLSAPQPPGAQSHAKDEKNQTTNPSDPVPTMRNS